MTHEQIVQIAEDEWDELYKSSIYPPSTNGIEWSHWLEGFEVALSKYQFTRYDMLAVYTTGDMNGLLRGKDTKTSSEIKNGVTPTEFIEQYQKEVNETLEQTRE